MYSEDCPGCNQLKIDNSKWNWDNLQGLKFKYIELIISNLISENCFVEEVADMLNRKTGLKHQLKPMDICDNDVDSSTPVIDDFESMDISMIIERLLVYY